LPTASTYHIWIANKRDGIAWNTTYPSSETSGITRSLYYNLLNEPRLATPLTTSISGSTITAQFTVTNYASSPVGIGYLFPAVRDSKGAQYDFPANAYNTTLQPGQTYTYNQSRTLPTASTYHIWIANKRDGIAWNTTYPSSQDSTLVRSRYLTIN
jgi:hypothetical protein